MAETKRVGRWYFGGLASMGAACCTHPLDLLKVHLQTQQKAEARMSTMAVGIVRTQGFLALYNGLSASLLRQATYSMTRFGIYDAAKKKLTEGTNEPMPYYQKVLVAGVAGFTGGVCGTPGDMINVRMQNDIKLPLEQRRNYKHALDGVMRVVKEEGFRRLFSGVSMASSRAVMVTIGQLSSYDQVKQTLLASGYFQDNLLTHFTSSLTAGAIATLMTQPVDVMKTRMMSAQPGTYNSIFSCAKDIAKNGPVGFYKGFVPAFIRLGPHTVLTFIFLEQLIKYAGYKQPV